MKLEKYYLEMKHLDRLYVELNNVIEILDGEENVDLAIEVIKEQRKKTINELNRMKCIEIKL